MASDINLTLVTNPCCISNKGEGGNKDGVIRSLSD